MNDTTHKTLEVEVLNIHKGEYLSEALKRQGYPMLPSNAIINKVMTGTGAYLHGVEPEVKSEKFYRNRTVSFCGGEQSASI